MDVRLFYFHVTKCILSNSKEVGKLEIAYSGVKMKQYSKVSYLKFELTETMFGESMSLKTIKKNKLKAKILA